MQQIPDFGLQARAIMLRKGITMEQIAQYVGISASYVSEILRGSRKGNKHKPQIMEFLEKHGGDISAASAKTS